MFITEFGRPVEPRNLLRVIEVASKAAAVEGVGVHTLRHSAAVSWLEAGAHIKAVADLLGHSSIASHWRCVRAHLRRHGTGRGERPGAATGDVRACRLGRVWVAVLRVARAISACPSQRC